MKKVTTRKKLGNPALVAAVASNPKAMKTAVNVGAVVLGLAVITVGGLAFYYLYWKNRFEKIPLEKNAAPASISATEAGLRAERIYKAMYGLGNGFDTVKKALTAVNRNGFILIYNAFGKRKPADSLRFGNAGNLSLTQWFADQFSESELKELRFLVSGTGFF